MAIRRMCSGATIRWGTGRSSPAMSVVNGRGHSWLRPEWSDRLHERPAGPASSALNAAATISAFFAGCQHRAPGTRVTRYSVGSTYPLR